MIACHILFLSLPIWSWWLIGVLVFYLLIALLLFTLQEWFMFHPEKLDQEFQYLYKHPFKEVFIDVEKDVRINALHFKVPESKGVVFYFKGNTRSIKGWGKFAKDFLEKKYDFFMCDYRGFGKSQGRRTQEGIIKDGNAAYHHLKREYLENQILIYGRSIGSGFSVKIAAMNKPQKLILDSPYANFKKLALRYLKIFPISKWMRFPIPSDEWMKDVHCPIYIIHGNKDRLIPPHLGGEKLKSLFPEKVKLFVIDGGTHNNLPSLEEYHQTLFKILEDG